MTINPETLVEDTEETKRERQQRTGAIGNGLTVLCTPNPEEPDAVEVKHRVVCLTKPYAACGMCQHGSFTLVFNVTPNARYERVLCPKWEGEARRLDGNSPDTYVPTEVATCEAKPFSFCPSCPSRAELQKLDIDKTKDGWYSRWKRFREEELEDE